jgi:hypothetical protein
VFTVTVNAPPVAAAATFVGEIAYVQAGGGGGGGSAAACCTVKICPAIVAVPVRAVCAALVPTSICTLPAPTPESVLGVSHDVAVVAVHVHPLCVFTVAVNAPPVAAAATFVGEIANVQAGGGGGGGSAAACCTVKICPAIVAVPVRAVCAALVPTSICTLPAPTPESVLSVSHDVALVAVHGHPDGVLMLMEASPPRAGTMRTVGLSEAVQPGAAPIL